MGKQKLAVESLIRHRMLLLHQIAMRQAPSIDDCKERQRKVVVIDGIHYGRFGNIMITIANALWLAEYHNASIILPDFAYQYVLKANVFDLSTFFSSFCFLRHLASGTEVIKSNAIGIYKVHELYDNGKFLPKIIDTTLIESAYNVHVRFLSSLWSSPSSRLLELGVKFITNVRSGNYTAIHKRNLEGSCNSMYCNRFNFSDLSASELPINLPEWQLFKQYDRDPKNCPEIYPEYPLCNLSTNIVRSILDMHDRSHDTIFL
eukprot:gene14680-31215_t